jgi:hypothetical protein
MLFKVMNAVVLGRLFEPSGREGRWQRGKVAERWKIK